MERLAIFEYMVHPLQELPDQQRLINRYFQGIWSIAEINNPDLKGKLGFPTSKRQLLNYFQVEVWVHPDRIEVKGIIPFNGKEALEHTVQAPEQSSSPVLD